MRHQQAKRRQKALKFKDKEESGIEENRIQINKNYKALQQLKDKDIMTLSKVIENSIVFALSKQGQFSKFKASTGGQATNAQKRKRKFMIGMANNTHAHQY